MVRSDPKTDRALHSLMELTGAGRSEAVRRAITIAEREARIARAERQALELRASGKDRAESLALLAEMEAGDAW